LSDKEIDSVLKADPEDRFPVLIGILDNTLQNRSGNAWFNAARRYAQTVYAFLDMFQIDIPVKRDMPDNDNVMPGWFGSFRTSIEYYTAAYRFRNAAEGTQQILNLNERRRSEIHELLNKVRLIVEGMDLVGNKRDVIMKRISKLQQEVDTSKTTLQNGLETAAAMIRIGKPLVRYGERLIKAYAGASADNDRAALAKPTAQITGPSETADPIVGQ
jgi:hypothetical protein